MSNIISVVLDGKHGPDGKLVEGKCVRRIVPIDLDKEEERGDVQWFFDADAGEDRWGLGNAEQGWWRIVDAYEWDDATVRLHEGKYPVAFHMPEPEFAQRVREANANDVKN